MVSPKNALSVDDKKLQQVRPMTRKPTLIKDEVTARNSKYFNKNILLVALLLSNILIGKQAFALSVQPLQVKSALGEPFRGQIVVTDIAGVDPASIRASLATDNEFIQLGISKQKLANDLQFSLSMTSPERGVITVTSSRALNDPYIEFVVHIGFGNSVRLQQVTALVDPPLTRIRTENLNLPVQQIQLPQASPTPTTMNIPAVNNPNIVKVTSSMTTRTIPLMASRSAPPPMSTPIAANATTPVTKTQDNPLVASRSIPPPMSAPVAETAAPALVKNAPAAAQETPLIPSANTPPPMMASANEGAQPPVEPTPAVVAPAPVEQVVQAPVAPVPVSTPLPLTAPPAPVTKNSYTVKRNDSLWSIANRVQKDTNQPISVIMHSIQQMNKAAFIHGNPNHIKNGATIILPNQPEPEEAPRIDTPPPEVENENVENNKTPVLRTPNQQAKAAKTPYIRQGNLPDAKMTLVAPVQQGTTQGSITEKKTEQSEVKVKQLTQLNLKVTAARQKNMTLSQEVSELEAKIKANDQILALRNARLAELMQHIKNRKDAVPQNTNRMPKS